MNNFKKTLCLAAAASVLAAAAPALADDVKLGFLADVTGPIAGFAGGMVSAGNLAVDQVNAQGGILGGQKLVSITADGACSADTAGPAADRLVNTEKVTAIFGDYCTGSTIAAANTAAIPGNVVMISPSASAPTVTTVKDNDLLFRTVVSDAFQGAKAAQLLLSQGVKEVGVTYVNNDYGKGLADQFVKSFTEGGGKVAANVAHEDGKADYRPEIGQIEATGVQTLVIYGYENAGGGAILNQAVEAGSFKLFVGGDGMAGDALLKSRDAASLEGMILTQSSAASGEVYDIYAKLATDAGLVPDTTYGPQSYDAAFLLALAIEKNGTADREGVSKALRDVANAPGEVIHPGEWQKAVELIKAGTDINYEGASGPIEFDEAGDVAGGIDYFVIEGGKIVNKGQIQ
ncbi:ABC transporter substrate-binding protein [Paradevosia shaoguanensis]|uniref:ABC transporter substrate-binding protein n=1 Tax=Paradevosia shaoguanensis TaxID=1335043 RepID=A0AA41UIH4_9HYPH|nr:ABC transporter substrate-binding protein [Paradevosia shaoguanensis]MCF1744858.1 ABC transporter substrate-binding protein [Paradevosia shaoguanensis]MCI0129341.1 ABC transporter substrate-binding protein [Paradevosia shaoguanensis]QMV00306.1 ABC transporter substrate-binding protein [Devosia sp. D6-9]CDP53785.1 Branched-chain amino acid ABC transporter, amino a cid-binding protein [Devosia sp. DBB001]